MNEDDDGSIQRRELAEFNTLVKQYIECFGEEPCWWVLGPSEDQARDIREAIRTGQPIVLNIPPGSVA